jgi:ribonuclease D
VALDTEGDSLHHYPERLALVQLAVPGGEAWLVDPLALPDLLPLAPLFADPAVTLVLHAGDNDLAHLKRRHAFRFARVFDTSIAARFLGGRALGLDVLLAEHLKVELPPSRQRDDWSVRPLTPAQEAYAVADVVHLFALRARLVEGLQAAGRLAWVEEECAALAAQVVPEREVDPDAYAGLKGARDLPPRGLAVLRELFDLREQAALKADRPPFKILPEDLLVRLAAAPPADAAALAALPGVTPRVAARWGEALLAAVARGLAVPEAELPVLARPPRRHVPAAVSRRVEAVRQWRAEAVTRVGLEAGVLLPNRVIRAIAEANPRTVDALAAVDGVRRWRAEAFGPEVVAALARA